MSLNKKQVKNKKTIKKSKIKNENKINKKNNKSNKINKKQVKNKKTIKKSKIKNENKINEKNNKSNKINKKQIKKQSNEKNKDKTKIIKKQLNEKNKIRKEIVKKLKKLKKEYFLIANEKIIKKLEKNKFILNSDIIIGYHPMLFEPNILDILKKYMDTKKIYLPVLKKDKLIFKKFNKKSKFKKNKYGILEPITNEILNVNNKDKKIFLIPGVAFDKNNNRLGKGKGYYDKSLEKTKNSIFIGICFKKQFLKSIPIEKHDIKMNKIITN